MRGKLLDRSQERQEKLHLRFLRERRGEPRRELLAAERVRVSGGVHLHQPHLSRARQVRQVQQQPRFRVRVRGGLVWQRGEMLGSPTLPVRGPQRQHVDGSGADGVSKKLLSRQLIKKIMI